MTKNPMRKSIYSLSLNLFLISRIATTLANQIITIAFGWQIYELTNSAFYLGLVGLMQFIPMILMTLFAGYAADHFNRKMIICICNITQVICFLLLAFASLYGAIYTAVILAAAFTVGLIDAFYRPSMQSLLPDIVQAEDFPKAAALSASGLQIASIIGPALGGLLYAFGTYIVYSAAALFVGISAGVILFIKVSARNLKKEPVTVKSLFADFNYIKSRPIILGAVSLDLFAVLLGGATALLPVYASTILHIGAEGLGVLRSAPAIGALFISLYLARKPIERKVGISMFIAVICFGLATIVFALSRSFYLSLAALIILGASDVVSVVIRSTLVQLQTPNEMRGRVSSINQVFIGTSNQLGEFESGITASLFGTVPAVLIGGIGTIGIVLLWMKLFPSLRKTDTFHDKI